ncbi:MAG: DUF2793 domain-containing protein [Sphingomonas sp.]|nr:DUF2793 domain-containing protein [Sphingomonas sp.]
MNWQLSQRRMQVLAGAPPERLASIIARIVIVAQGAAGDFAGRDNALALLGEDGWRFLLPFIGMTARIAGTGIEWRFDGTDWIEGSLEVREIAVSGVKVVGAQQPDIVAPIGGTTSDSEARTAISAILDALRAHGLIAGAQ